MKRFLLLGLTVIITTLLCGCFGNTALHDAAFGGQLERVEKLIKNGENVNVKSKLGMTPLHKACKQGHIDLVKFLIKAGADVKIMDDYGRTPLHCAGESGHLEIVKILETAGADINQSGGKNKRAPLHSAIWKGSGGLIVAKYLVEVGAKVNAKELGGFTALHIACRIDYLDMVKLLIGAGADINIRSDDGFTPLHTAAVLGNLEVIKYLVEKGADISLRDTKYGKNALEYAQNKKHKDVVTFLEKSGAKK